MKMTRYFETSVLTRRPYLTTDVILMVLADPIRTEIQSNGRIRHWALVATTGKYLRVVTEGDGETVHNAFYDRRFRP